MKRENRGLWLGVLGVLGVAIFAARRTADLAVVLTVFLGKRMALPR